MNLINQKGKIFCVALCLSTGLIAFLTVTVSFARTVSFSAATNFPVGSAPSSVAVGDFNGDRKLDLAVANYNDNNVSILPPKSSRAFNEVISSKDQKVLSFPSSGHVGMTVGSQAQTALWPRVVNWLVERS